MEDHRIVPHEEWLDARRELLAKEKEFSRLRDELSRARRELPWERVDKAYAFDGPQGRQSLADLFGGKSQLIVFHIMFNPDWEAACKHCSFWADSVERNVVHLGARDVSFVAISRAPLAKLEAMKRRMGWTFTWLSSGEGDFNYDYGVSFRAEDRGKGEIDYNYARQKSQMSDLTGVSVFYKDAQGAVFHTYSTYARGVDMLNAAYAYLDLTPKGRDEDNLPFTQAWVRYRDSYGI